MSGSGTDDVNAIIQSLVDKETQAWNDKDADTLVSLFHPDMVWPWPKDANSHNPVDWIMPFGRFDSQRWKSAWQELFDTHTLVHNKRHTVKILVSDQQDAALAVVDIDTLWMDDSGNENHWQGRVSKAFTKVGDDWKLIMHTGVLNYDFRD